MESSRRVEGLKGKVTAYINLVSINKVWVWPVDGRLDSFSWILRMNEMGTLSSNSFTGVYRFRILMI